jgi:dihydrofolate reductase
MKLSIIVAMGSNRVIGNRNALPWHLPADLAHFKAITMGKPILMGRRTHESIGRPLPGRENIVITRNRDYTAAGCTVVHSLEEAVQAAAGHHEIMIIGGAELYRQALPQVDVLYLTRVEGEFAGDAFFPELDDRQWREVERSEHAPDARNPHCYSFITLERMRDASP